MNNQEVIEKDIEVALVGEIDEGVAGVRCGDIDGKLFPLCRCRGGDQLIPELWVGIAGIEENLLRSAYRGIYVSKNVLTGTRYKRRAIHQATSARYKGLPDHAGVNAISSKGAKKR